MLACSLICGYSFPGSAQPSNDNFSNRLSIIGSNITFAVSNVGASSEAGEPGPSPLNDASSSVWYTWTAPFSGGATIEIVADGPFFNPLLAVFTNNTLASLSRLVYCIGSFKRARVTFNAIAGQVYQIDLDGLGGAQGTGMISLKLSPPPINDSFSNGIPVSGNYFTNAGSFIGATRESLEPNHGDATLGQTIWWTWMAPTNNGVNSSQVSLTADGVSFPPGMGVYLGNSVSNLTPVQLFQKNGVTNTGVATNGMTSTALFTATAGTTYHIALAGRQQDPIGNDISPRYGDYRFRLNNRALALSILNSSGISNADESVSYSADARVDNLGPVTSNPLRLYISAISGISLQGPDDGSTVVTQIFQAIFPASPFVLGSGQNTTNHLSGVCPAPTNSSKTNPDGTTTTIGVGYGIYAELQQAVLDTWFAVDQQLVLFGNWPTLGQFSGPGGGVIRLDPGYGSSVNNVLTNVVILGSPTVPEGTTTNYSGKAMWLDGTSILFANTAWSASRFNIATNGEFTAGSVTSNTAVSLFAPVIDGSSGFPHTGTVSVVVLNVLPWLTTPRLQTNGTVALTLNGFPALTNTIEATTNLTPPATWLPLGTNATTNGVWIFVDPFASNITQRFYRARELP